MKDKDLFVFILFEIVLIVITIWGFYNHFPLLAYGPLTFLVINTIAIILKLSGKDGGGKGGNGGNGGDNGDGK